MTAPTEPTPGAPATEPTAQPAQPIQTEPAPGAPEQSTQDIASLPDWAQKALKDARAEAGKARTTAKQTAAQEARAELLAQFQKAIGAGDEPATPEQLTAQITESQEAAWRSTLELQTYRVAVRLGADPDALMDSRTFVDALHDIDGDDPRSPEFTAAVEAQVKAALERNPAYRAAGLPAGTSAPRPDPSQGARGAGPTLDSRIAEAQAKGDWLRVISLQNQKLTTK